MSAQTQQTAPPYSEEQVTRWLTFLARGMTERDQTIFLIEKLQPSWLFKGWYQRAYILMSRMVWGFFGGLVFMLVGTLIIIQREILYRGGFPYSLHELLLESWQLSLGTGLFFGLSLGLSGMAQTNAKIVMLQNRYLRFWGIASDIMSFLLSYWLIVIPIGYSYAGLIFLLLFSPIWIERSLKRTFDSEIFTIEAIRFFWRRSLKGIFRGLLGGLVLGCLAWLYYWRYFGLLLQSGRGPEILATRQDIVRNAIWLMGPYSGLIGGLIGGLICSIQSNVLELKNAPNQGIRLSLRSAGLMGSAGGIVLGVIIGLFSSNWITGLAYGAITGLCIALWYGGLDVIQHYIVRFLLWRSGSLPWRLAPFLDYAAEELHFLQKVGGGYIFVHRYLLEHFAAMGEETTDG